MAPQNIPSVTVLTLGSKVVLYHAESVLSGQPFSTGVTGQAFCLHVAENGREKKNCDYFSSVKYLWKVYVQFTISDTPTIKEKNLYVAGHSSGAGRPGLSVLTSLLVSVDVKNY